MVSLLNLAKTRPNGRSVITHSSLWGWVSPEPGGDWALGERYRWPSNEPHRFPLGGPFSPWAYPGDQRWAETDGRDIRLPSSQPSVLAAAQEFSLVRRWKIEGSRVSHLSYSTAAEQGNSVLRQDGGFTWWDKYSLTDDPVVRTWQQVLQQPQYFQQQSRRRASSRRRKSRRGSNHRRLAGGQSSAMSFKQSFI